MRATVEESTRETSRQPVSPAGPGTWNPAGERPHGLSARSCRCAARRAMSFSPPRTTARCTCAKACRAGAGAMSAVPMDVMDLAFSGVRMHGASVEVRDPRADPFLSSGAMDPAHSALAPLLLSAGPHPVNDFAMAAAGPAGCRWQLRRGRVPRWPVRAGGIPEKQSPRPVRGRMIRAVWRIAAPWRSRWAGLAAKGFP